MLVKIGRNRRQWIGRYAAPPDLDETYDERHEPRNSSQKSYSSFPVNDHKDKWFPRPISRSSVRTGAQNGIDYYGGAKMRGGKDPNSVWCAFGGGR